MIYRDLENLLNFARQRLMLVERDLLVARHRLYLFLQLEGAGLSEHKNDTSCEEPPQSIYQICEPILEWAAENSRYDGDSTTEADLFLANLIGQVMPLSSAVQGHFWNLYRASPEQATAFFYQLSQDSAYIRSDRLAQNFSWESEWQNKQMEITINLSKPEKDPKAIAAAGAIAAAAGQQSINQQSINKQSASYPQCVLCIENEGYPGHLSWAPRFNHRIVDLQLGGSDFALQYSPYLYYPEHSIVLSKEHKPMAITPHVFIELFDFVEQFPHYMIGSNADLPIVGGSILSHHHFQAGCYEFPMFRASALMRMELDPELGVVVEILDWPLSVLKLSAARSEPLIALGAHILETWRGYSDEANGILAETDAPHNTITPILRRSFEGSEGSAGYEFYLVLRNNRTTAQHPMGIYHPHAEIHHVKKENIGLIEVMGLAILPGRLKHEMILMQKYLQVRDGSESEAAKAKAALLQDKALEAHLPWLDSLELDSQNLQGGLEALLRREIAEVFARGLSHCGVLPSAESWQGFFQALNILASEG